jgi:hypothetical protein
MGGVHIRRALLLFAIVLGMAALVASLSRPADERPGETTAREPSESAPPTATASPAPERPATLSFDASEEQTKRLAEGSAAIVEVAVDEPGSVRIPGLGRSAPANPLTPARFDILATEPGEYELLFQPAGSETSETAGRLVVTSAG